MCGICGILNFDHAAGVDERLIRTMASSLQHRGPDGEGFFVEGPVGLGHRRLAIIDLAGGKQPIFNEDGSCAVVFNGEIYNYQDLARELTARGHTFRTRSDTETILHAYEEYGEDCVDHLRGMFTFAIWDSRNRRLFIARDRLGIKPLYYYRDANFLAFASEIKAILEIPEVGRAIDPESLELYLSLRYVPGPRTMFSNIFCLQPGQTLSVDSRGVRIRQYWDVEYAPREHNNAAGEFRELLDESVRLRLISEVPLGVFLSGGLDSSAILAIMSRVAPGLVKTFSIGYESGSETREETEASEFEYARLAAKTFGADHHSYRLTAKEFEQFIPQLVWHLDEPMADPSCIPLYFIAKLAREHITVVLSGEGADEILAGYGIYSRMLTLDRIRRGVPGLGRVTPWLSRLTSNDRVRRYLQMAGSDMENYRGVCRGFTFEATRNLIGDHRALRSKQRLDAIFGAHFDSVKHASPLNRMLYVDAKTWLPDDLLNKADKMTMANGLELRVPFLDHKLVEFAAGLPDESKLNGKTGKSLLRQIMRGVLPDPILDRPKKGFPVPLASWLRGPIRESTRDNLLSGNSACIRYFDRQAIAQTVEQHERGTNYSQEIWSLLVFEFWHRQFMENATPKALENCAA